MGPITAKAKVFIVDDDTAVRDSIKILLELHDLEVEDYESTEMFIRHYRKPSRGCVILDQHLPKTTGLDFLTSAAGQSLGIPVLLITGRGDDDTRERAMRAGAAAYLNKPIAGEFLLATIDLLLEPSR